MTASTASKSKRKLKSQSAPNILFITVDQMRYPDTSDECSGMNKGLKEIFGFQALSDNNPYIKQFPGFMRLRKNAVSLQNHHIAASACVPSRTSIYTGQYGTRTKVMETDSLFKYGSDPAFPWLDARGIPTIGDWFREAGYDTHYFGKWDLSYADVEGPQKGDINDWGFADWKLSSPDAQGGQLNQLGIYRDPGYADLACTFLRRKAMNFESAQDNPKPWFATVSIVNPHDIASAYPISWWMPDKLEVPQPDSVSSPAPNGVQTIVSGSDLDHPATPKPVPAKNSRSNPLPGGTYQVDLNPTGFGTEESLFTNPASLTEDLTTKPDCQFDYSYKMGLALKSRRPEFIRDWQTLPFQTFADQGHPELSQKWFQAYGQFYAYLHTLADQQIDRVLKTLDQAGLTDNTIVVFLSDHGEYGGTHGGMIEKWHTAYDPILHVPVVFSSPLLNPQNHDMRSVTQLTSHIDILPTLLGLAGFESYSQQHQLGLQLSQNQDQTYVPLPGVNLLDTLNEPNQQIRFPSFPSEGDGQPRNEILFITDDTITNHLVGEAPTRSYHRFVKMVDEYLEIQPRLQPGSVRQPNHIRCIKWTIEESDNDLLNGMTWKLARYWDPAGNEDDQWEFYNLDDDPAEVTNLVTWSDGEPVIAVSRIPEGSELVGDDLQQALNESRSRLLLLEKLYLEPVSPFEEAYVLEKINSTK